MPINPLTGTDKADKTSKIVGNCRIMPIIYQHYFIGNCRQSIADKVGALPSISVKS